MQTGNKFVGLALAVAIMAVPAVGFAVDLKSLMTEAITKEKSSGYLDPEVAKLFTPYTKSNAPVQLMAKRIETYSERCAKLDILINQPNAPMANGEKGVFLLRFQLPMCLDGTYPAMLKSLDDERKKHEASQCSQSVKNGVVKDGFMNSLITFKNCPSNGVVGIFYDGSCKDLNPGPTSVVREYNFDEQGTAFIKILTPQSCLKAKSNAWQLFLFERPNPKAGKVMIGKRVISTN